MTNEESKDFNAIILGQLRLCITENIDHAQLSMTDKGYRLTITIEKEEE